MILNTVEQNLWVKTKYMEQLLQVVQIERKIDKNTKGILLNFFLSSKQKVELNELVHFVNKYKEKDENGVEIEKEKITLVSDILDNNKDSVLLWTANKVHNETKEILTTYVLYSSYPFILDLNDVLKCDKEKLKEEACDIKLSIDDAIFECNALLKDEENNKFAFKIKDSNNLIYLSSVDFWEFNKTQTTSIQDNKSDPQVETLVNP